MFCYVIGGYPNAPRMKEIASLGKQNFRFSWGSMPPSPQEGAHDTGNRSYRIWKQVIRNPGSTPAGYDVGMNDIVENLSDYSLTKL